MILNIGKGALMDLIFAMPPDCSAGKNLTRYLRVT